MLSYYDTYDYPSYWKGRDYEHESEKIALTEFFKQIPKSANLLEIGAGFGRLTPIYLEFADKIILSDPSKKSILQAKERYNQKKISFIVSSLRGLLRQVDENSVDTVVMVRVIHHMNGLDDAFSQVAYLLKKGGYFVLEFPNKAHMKAVIHDVFKGNLMAILDIFPKDLRSVRAKRLKSIPFTNYHPEAVIESLKSHGFKIVSIRSVSNFRFPLVKKILPQKLLLNLESRLQKSLAKLFFGPSIFILAKKG
jgi:ubiquinone/menaquinone biosynthesis C-methylase UbiE